MPVKRAAGAAQVEPRPIVTAPEDFAIYRKRTPGVFYFLGVNAGGVAAKDAAPSHSPDFVVDAAALATGARAHVLTALDCPSG